MTARSLSLTALCLAALAGASPLSAQRGGGPGGRGGGPGGGAPSFPTNDPVIRRIWELGMEQSHVERIAQTLLDSVGPRLTASPGIDAAHDWTVKMYASWGIPARNERYGTYLGWRRGITHVDLIRPRVRTLEATMLAWSAGTNGAVEGDVVAFPDFNAPADFDAWLPQVRGKFVAVVLPEISCRPQAQWEEFALPESIARLEQQRQEAQRRFTAWRGTGQTAISAGQIAQRIEEAGALGIFQFNWERETGINNISRAALRRIPTIDLSCEDYGLVYRLARNGQGPRVRVEAQAEYLGQVPVFNTIAEMKGTQLPNEYVMLSAHFDSWDSASGATDNGTGTTVMMEAMRILKQAYPNPKRTIVAGHWGGEEQGLNGSRAFAHDHPEIVQGLQALFNQDNGTGRVVNIGMQGLTGAGAFFGKWMAVIPENITRNIDLGIPGRPGSGGSDYASFICYGAPAFGLSSLSWDYSTYTHHTNRDTFDKVVVDEVKNNATLTAMLVYLASEEAERIPRDRRDLGNASWPQCRDGARTGGD